MTIEITPQRIAYGIEILIGLLIFGLYIKSCFKIRNNKENRFVNGWDVMFVVGSFTLSIATLLTTIVWIVSLHKGYWYPNFNM